MIIWSATRIDDELSNKFRHTFQFNLRDFYTFHGFDVIKFSDYFNIEDMSTKSYVELRFGVDAVKLIEDIFEHDRLFKNPPVQQFTPEKGHHLISLGNGKVSQIEQVKTLYKSINFAIHKGYTITHLPTGFFVMTVKSLKKAKDVVSELVKVKGTDRAMDMDFETWQQISELKLKFG